MLVSNPFALAALLATGLLTGGLIGSVGVGGVLLTPVLTLLIGFDVHVAMATSSFSFIFTGLIGTAAYARRGSIRWRSVAWLSGPVLPAAMLGARANTLLSPNALLLILAALLAWSGLRALRSARPGKAVRAEPLPVPLLLTVGAVAGFGSALTGTGGPVLLLPMLLLLGLSALPAIGISQVVQLPIALFSSVGFFLHGSVNVTAGILLGVTQAAGVLVGARLAHALPGRRLSQLVAYTLIAVALLLIIRAA